MHAVHTRTCFLTPATTARKRFRFGFHRRRRVLFAWLITFPKCGALPQNSHFSAIFLPAQNLFWASVSRSKYRKTKLLILADPPPPAKRGVSAPDGFAEYAFCIPDGSSGRGFAYQVVLPLRHALFFRTGSRSAVRTSNPSNRIEATGFAGTKGVPLAARTIVDLVLHA
jgi:hypothetical protein